jgi:hypothetical protein
MSEQIYQIYHVARCGSTLLTSLLSDVATVYSEPSWASSLLLGLDPYKNMESFYGSVVKFPSMVSCYPTNFPGKKVFLYRPLAQHLCKMKSVDSLWIQSRLKRIDYIFKNHNHPKIVNFNPQTELEKITYLWMCSIFCMLDVENLLWIKTNDFLNDKEDILNKVCYHFDLPYVTDFYISNIDVKRSGINVKDSPISKSYNSDLNFKYVIPSYGIIETDLALYDSEISEIVKLIENNFPELDQFLY